MVDRCESGEGAATGTVRAPTRRDMRRTTRSIGLFCIALAIPAAGGCYATAPDRFVAAGSLETMKPITLRVNESVSAQSGAGKAWQDYLDRVEKATGGKVRFDEYYLNSLVTNKEVVPAIADGVVDIGQVTLQDGFQDELPVANFVSQATGLIDPTFPISLLQWRAATIEYFNSSPAVDAESERAGGKILFAGSSGYGNLLCTKPVETLRDARGLRVRVDGGVSKDDAEALGMQPTILDATELYGAMQRGVIDCVMASDGGENFVALGLTDVARYFVPVNLAPTAGFGMTMNRDLWNSFPEEVRRIFVEELADYEIDRNRSRIEGFQKFVRVADEKRIVWQNPVELNEALAQRRKSQLGELIRNAPPELENPRQAIREYEVLLEEWKVVAERVSGVEPAPNGLDSDALRTAYLSAADRIRWDAYRQALTEMYREND